jgi:hypothetical protein
MRIEFMPITRTTWIRYAAVDLTDCRQYPWCNRCERYCSELFQQGSGFMAQSDTWPRRYGFDHEIPPFSKTDFAESYGRIG